MKELWTEKYRPTNVNDYVFKDNTQKEQVKSWLKSGAIPHLLFSGCQGAGKTTIAKVLLHELDVNPFDILQINASANNGVDYIRDTITDYSTSMPFGEFKYILLDEADYLSPNAQAALRGVMEKYSTTTRFILTCNYPNKIIPAIHSRCQGFDIQKLDVVEFTVRIATILASENVMFDVDTLDMYVSGSYPDMRKCINLCQQNSQDGTLQQPGSNDSSVSDYKIEAIALFRNKKYIEARKLICSQITADEYHDMYRFMYTNLDLWCDTDVELENAAIRIIRKGLVSHTSCADSEINLAAVLCELEEVAALQS